MMPGVVEKLQPNSRRLNLNMHIFTAGAFKESVARGIWITLLLS